MRWTGVLVLIVGLVAAACARHDMEQHGEDHGEHDMHDGAISFSRQGQAFKTTVLGGLVGSDSVSDVKVGVYVLQAESPERLRPNGSGPTHLFNLTLMDEKTEELIHEGSGTVTVTGADGRNLREPFERFESHFQARVRLERPGDYQVTVDFETKVGSGTTAPLQFSYRWKDADDQSGVHNH